jgi:hypothetical protein
MPTPEANYNTFVNTIVAGYEKNSREYKILAEAIEEAPLYLVSEGQYNKALDQWQEGTLPINTALLTRSLPIIFSDHMGTVLLASAMESGDSLQMHAFGMIDVPEADRRSNDFVSIFAANVLVQTGSLRYSDTANMQVQEGWSVSLTKRGSKWDPIHATDLADPNAQFRDAVARDVATNIAMAMTEFFFVTQPRAVVVREEDGKLLKKRRSQIERTGKLPKDLPKSREKETHIYLDPTQVQEIVRHKETAAGRSAPAPHKRRAHQRTFKHPRYKAARGKTIVVDAMEVGVKPGEVIKTPRKVYHIVSVGGKSDES